MLNFSFARRLQKDSLAVLELFIPLPPFSLYDLLLPAVYVPSLRPTFSHTGEGGAAYS